MKKSLILIGGGGHCHACIDIIEKQGLYSIKGIIDQKERIGESILGYPIIGSDDDIETLSKKFNFFFITIGQIKSSEKRIRLFNTLIDMNLKIPSIVSPYAVLGKNTTIGDGSVVMHHAIINTNSIIGRNCIINTKALIEHDSRIGDNCHVSTSAVLNGGVKLGDGCFVGSNSVINQDVRVTSGVIIASGSVVHKDIKKAGIYSGNPVRRLRDG